MNRCQNPTGTNRRFEICGKFIPEDDIESVKTELGLCCGECVEAMFSKTDDPLDALGRPKQARRAAGTFAKTGRAVEMIRG